MAIAEYRKQQGIATSVDPLLQISHSPQVQHLVRPFEEDGRDFIKAAARRVWGDPFPEFTPIISKSQAKREKRALVSGGSRETTLVSASAPAPASSAPVLQAKSRRQISHFVMNLPDSAIEFLDAFRGIFAEPELREAYEGRMPMVHCHCFTREAEDPTRAERDVRQVSVAAAVWRCWTLRRLTMCRTESGRQTRTCADRRCDVSPCSVGCAWQGHVLHKF